MSASGWHRKRTTPNDVARAREYASPQHKAAVRAVKAAVAAGNAHCWRCGQHLPPGTRAHAGHDDHDRTIYRGPECPPCNLKTAARRGARIRNAQAKTSRLTW